MKTNDLSVSTVVAELVKNAIDAQSTVVQIELNGSFDIRVVDDGCGFDRHAIQEIGERQIFFSDAMRKNQFRYGRKGKFLFRAAQITSEIYIESIQHKTDVRFYKTIISNKSVYKVYETDRKYKDAMVKTKQGSMVVLNGLNVDIGDDTVMQKMNIVNSVMELALINFKVNISVKDTATQQTLYESYSTKNLFDKFERFLESNQFFSKIQSVSCEKHNVKVELLLCEDGTSTKAFQFVYFNQLCERSGKWTKFTNKLCKERLKKDLNAKRPVYLINIRAENYPNNELAHNVIIDKCIRKCVEQLSQPLSKSCAVLPDQPTISKTNHRVTINEAPPKEHGNESQIQGVRLGDWIFNNSCENYEQLNQGRESYRKKICENWVISLEKPQPKDVNDSLNCAAINASKVQPDDHRIFKKPRSRNRRASTTKIKTKNKPHVSSQIYKPSQQVKAFNNSTLIRASKKLIFKTTFNKKRKISTKKRVEHQLEMNLPNTLRHDSESQHRKSLDNVNSMRMTPIHEIGAIPNASFEGLNHLSDLNNLNDELMFQNQPANYMPDIADKSNDHFQIYKSTKKTMDFTLHKSRQATNFNMNFSSSIAIHTMADDPFMGILEKNAGESNSISNLFPSNAPSLNIPFNVSQPESNRIPESNGLPEWNHMPELNHRLPEWNRPSGSSVYSETSQLQYRQNRNDSIRTHYRQQTYRNFNRNNSSLNSNRNEISSGCDTSNRRPRSIQSATQSGTDVAPIGRQTPALGLLSDEVRQTGWPVTININFGQTK